MLVRDLTTCDEFIAGDSTILRELFHRDKGNLSIKYSLAHAKLKPGTQSYPHRLTTSEVYYILEGTGRMHIDAETQDVRPHQAIYIPPNSRQFIENIGNNDLIFLCIVDPAWRKEDETVG